ncbi:hypothetical protein QBC44DRAFT_112774 [Cladorrhinum sp. PSN332]|nr:hypothetical protein QBC44DRAFT_112774 [Cladorrhinum sp. PSN332]
MAPPNELHNADSGDEVSSKRPEARQTGTDQVCDDEGQGLIQVASASSWSFAPIMADGSDDSDDSDDNDLSAIIGKRRQPNVTRNWSHTAPTRTMAPPEGSLAALALTRPREVRNGNNNNNLGGWRFLQTDAQRSIAAQAAPQPATTLSESMSTTQRSSGRSREERERDRERTLRRVKELEERASLSVAISSTPVLNRHRDMRYTSAAPGNFRKSKRSKEERRRRKEKHREERRREKRHRYDRHREGGRREVHRRDAPAGSYEPNPFHAPARGSDPILKNLRPQQHNRALHDRLTYNDIKLTPLMAGAKARSRIEEMKAREQRVPVPHRQPPATQRQSGRSGALTVDLLEGFFRRANIGERDRERRRREENQPQQKPQETQKSQQRRQVDDLEDPVDQYRRIAAATQQPSRTTQVVSSLPPYNYQEERTRVTTNAKDENARRSALLLAKGPFRGTAVLDPRPSTSGEARQPHYFTKKPTTKSKPRPAKQPLSRKPKCKRCHGLHLTNCSGPPRCSNCVTDKKECRPMNHHHHHYERAPRESALHYESTPPSPSHRPSSPSPSPPPSSSVEASPPPPPDFNNNKNNNKKKKAPASQILGPDAIITLYTVLRTPKAPGHPASGSQIRMGEYFSLVQANRYAHAALHKPRKDVIGRRYELVVAPGGEKGTEMGTGYFEGEVSYVGGRKEMWWVVREEKDLRGLEKRMTGGKEEVLVEEGRASVYKRERWDVWFVVGKLIATFGGGEAGGRVDGEEGEEEDVLGEDGEQEEGKMPEDGEVHDAEGENGAEEENTMHIGEDEEGDDTLPNDQKRAPMGVAERIQRLRELNPFYAPAPRQNNDTESEEEDTANDEEEEPGLDPSRPLSEQIEWDYTLHNSYTTACEAYKAALNRFFEIGKPRINASKAAARYFDLICQELKAGLANRKALEPGFGEGLQFSWEPPAEHLRHYSFLALVMHVQHTSLQGPVELSGIVLTEDDDGMRRARPVKKATERAAAVVGGEDEYEGDTEEEDGDVDVDMSEEE